LSEEYKSELLKIYPDQDSFIKKLLYFWTGSTIIHKSEQYIIQNKRTTTNRTALLESHTCFYTLELSENIFETLTPDDLMKNIVILINDSGTFTAVGGRRRRYKKTKKHHGNKRTKKYGNKLQKKTKKYGNKLQKKTKKYRKI